MVKIWWKSIERLKRYSKHKYLGGCHFGHLFLNVLKLKQIPISWKYISRFLVKIWWKVVERLKRYSNHKYLDGCHLGCHFVFHHIEIITYSNKLEMYFKIFGENLMKNGWRVEEIWQTQISRWMPFWTPFCFLPYWNYNRFL